METCHSPFPEGEFQHESPPLAAIDRFSAKRRHKKTVPRKKSDLIFQMQIHAGKKPVLSYFITYSIGFSYIGVYIITLQQNFRNNTY